MPKGKEEILDRVEQSGLAMDHQQVFLTNCYSYEATASCLLNAWSVAFSIVGDIYVLSKEQTIHFICYA